MAIKLQKTSKITTIIVITLISLIVIVPTASALQFEGTYDKWCKMQLNNDKLTWRDGLCEVDIYQMFRSINSLTNKVSDLQTNMSDTQKTMDIVIKSTQDNQQKIENVTALPFDLDYRLQILEGKIHAPFVDLTAHVYPEKISKGDKFEISGSADRMVEQYWVGFNFYNPNGESVQFEWIPIQPNNIYFSDILEPNFKWDMIGNYTIQIVHGPHVVNATIQYLG